MLLWNLYLSIKQKELGYHHENVAQNEKLALFLDCAVEQQMVTQDISIAMWNINKYQYRIISAVDSWNY
jgi:hypothetical protein